VWVTRTYPKRGFYCPSGNVVTSADWGGIKPPVRMTNYELREDTFFELREDLSAEIRE